MNRYTLFLVLVGLYTNITLPNLTQENTENVDKDLMINQLFTNPFNMHVIKSQKDKLSFLFSDWSTMNNNKRFSNQCESYLKEVINRLSGTEKQNLEDIKEEIAFCLAEFARIKIEYDYEREMSILFGFKSGYNQETKKERGQRAFTEVRTIFLKEGEFKNLSYLFDSYTSQKGVLNEFQKSCDLRLISIRAREFLRKDAERESAPKAKRETPSAVSISEPKIQAKKSLLLSTLDKIEFQNKNLMEYLEKNPRNDAK